MSGSSGRLDQKHLTFPRRRQLGGSPQEFDHARQWRQLAYRPTGASGRPTLAPHHPLGTAPLTASAPADNAPARTAALRMDTATGTIGGPYAPPALLADPQGLR